MAVKKWIFDLNILQKSRIPRMELVQGDTDANVFQIHLKTLERYTEVPLDLTDSYVTVTVKKADDTIVVGEAQIIDSTNGIIEYTCRGNELSYPGLVIATIEVYDTTHIKRFTTTQFKFYVVEQLDDGSGIPSTTEYTVLTDLIAQTQSVVTNENERIENENTRIANENIRQENESIRQNNEQARVTAENNRVNAESIREANENERINNENIRQANEETRNTAEANREQAENLRQMAEQERINAENARVAAENARNEAELARKNAENIRQSNESARISEENTRILQENARVQVENERIANENIREANEAVRQNNESVRITAEGNRVQAEAIREANEAERISNENTRIANENTRQSNEAIRQNNESIRQSNEATRINNENIRQQQEQARQTSMADIENRWATLTTAQQQDAEVIDARTSTIKNKTFPALNDRLEEIEYDIVNPVYSDEVVIEGGIGSIPSNAAEGQVSVTVKGNTETDEEGNTKSTVGAVRIKSVGKNLLSLKSKRILINKTASPTTSAPYFRDYDIIIGATRNGYIDSMLVQIYEFTENRIDMMNTVPAFGIGVKFKANSGETYVRSNSIYGIGFFDKDGNLLAHTSATSIVTAPSGTAFGFAIIAPFQVGVRTVLENFQVERGTIATPYEPYRESDAYVIAKDPETNEILQLRSLPNGTKDEFSLTQGKLIKRVSNEVVLDGSYDWVLNTTDDTKTVIQLSLADTLLIFPNSTNYSAIYGYNADMIFSSVLPMGAVGRVVFVNGIFHIVLPLPNSTLADAKNYLNNKPVKLIYQLAEPVITQYQPQSLIGYPNGTVYWEPVVKDIAIYNNGIAIVNPNIPIKAIQAVYKIDGQSKIEIPLANVTVAGDKLSFTITGAQNGEAYEYIYEYDTSLTTIPTIEATVNMNLKAVVNSTSKAVDSLNKYTLDLNAFTVAMLLNHEMRLTLLEVQ